MIRKIITFLSLVLITAFVLSACGTPAEEPAAPAGEDSAAEEPAAEEPSTEEPVTITWWHISTAEEHKALWQKLAD